MRGFAKRGIQPGGVSRSRDRWFAKQRKQHGGNPKRRPIRQSDFGRKRDFGQECDFGCSHERIDDDFIGLRG